ncbi:MAG TPA: DinB family protein [Thermoanaerobaculia bacterium]|nr:DinB family protein [Thermoanaerobaculia bacterium]
MGAVAELARIREQLERIDALCRDARLFTVNERVSAWSPAEHVDHLLKVTKSILDRLPSDEAVPRGISLLGRAVLGLRWIPRGRGRTPERLTGKQCTPEELRARLTRVTMAAEGVDTAAVDTARIPNVPHPRFGGLTPAQALRFVTVHTEHHLKIVRDILR